METRATGFIKHLETTLSEITQGWKADQINVASFSKQPFEQAVTYVTLGLSHHILALPHQRIVRLELIFTAYENYADNYIVSFLEDVSNLILSEHQAILRGEFIKLANPIIPLSPLNYVYVTIPSSIFDETLDIYKDSEPATILALLIPIREAEAQFIQKYGWNKFEDIMEVADWDMFDLDRKIIPNCLPPPIFQEF